MLGTSTTSRRDADFDWVLLCSGVAMLAVLVWLGALLFCLGWAVWYWLALAWYTR